MTAKSRLCIGTANFGLEYGIANKSGKLSDTAIKAILKLAQVNNIVSFDTAEAYGDSSARLSNGVNSEVKITSKISIFPTTINKIETAFEEKINKLLKSFPNHKVDTLLLHNPDVLVGNPGRQITNLMLEAKKAGYMKKIGISLYCPSTLEKIKDNFNFDVIQAPFNVFDQRIFNSGWVTRLIKQNVRIQTRSTFLQGLLLIKPSDLPFSASDKMRNMLNTWASFHKHSKYSAETICLKYALNQRWIDEVIVGVDSVKQLSRLIEIEQMDAEPKIIGFNVSDPAIIDPRKWPIN